MSRLVVVTGAASGIGLAAARRFAASGDEVVGVDLDPAVLAVGGVVLDHTDRAGVEAFVAGLPRSVDVLCANAGVGVTPLPVAEMNYERWQRTFLVNVDGAMLMSRAVLTRMPDHAGASVVFTASTAGLRGYPGGADYGAAKAALISYGVSLGLEVAPRGIRVNVVCPGGVRTPLIEKLYGDRTSEVYAAAAREVPLGRVAEAADVAAAIAFLASDDARHITATTLVVDGGGSARPG